MDLRELLAEALVEIIETHFDPTPELPWPTTAMAHAILARLSRPDVLDEFERRFFAQMDSQVVAAVARRVLADMLGGGS